MFYNTFTLFFQWMFVYSEFDISRVVSLKYNSHVYNLRNQNENKNNNKRSLRCNIWYLSSSLPKYLLNDNNDSSCPVY